MSRSKPPIAASVIDWSSAALLAVGSMIIWQLLLKHSDPQVDTSVPNGLGRDAFDSPYYGATWLLFPTTTFLVGLLRPGVARVFALTLAIIVPLMVIVCIDGVRWDAQAGANFWPLGEIFLLVQGAATLAAGALGSAAGRTRYRNGRRSL